MKFVMVSREGDGCEILNRILQEGNEVELFITEKDDRKSWDGILPKVETLPLDKDAVYIFDSSGNGKIADNLIHKGYHVVGGSSTADDLEFDRGKAIDLMHDVGMEIPETHTFDKFDEVREFLREHSDHLYVLKPSGKDLPCHLSYVPQEEEDISDTIRYVNWVEKAYGKDIKEIEVQYFEEGIAVSTEGWFNGFHFIYPFNHTIENKKFLNGNLGPSTGCSGNIVWPCEVDEFVKDVRKLESYLQGRYIGPVDWNSILTKSGERKGLEFTIRHGYDAICALLKLMKSEVGKFYADLARNQFEGEMELAEEFAAAIRVTIPPYPNDGAKVVSGTPISGFNDMSDYYFYEIAWYDSGLVHEGSAGVLLCTLGKGSATNSITDAEKLAEKLIIPNKQYRTDLSHVLVKDLYKFQDLMEEVYA